MEREEGRWGLHGGNGRRTTANDGGSMSPDGSAVGPAADFPLDDFENAMPSTLSILLPALNEENGVLKVLRGIPRRRLERLGIAYDVYLLDGHSTDRTRSIAWKMGAQVIVQSGNGKGAAVREFLPKIGSDVTVLLDCDGTYPPEMIPHFVDALGNGALVVLGTRLRGSKMDDGAMTALNRVGNHLLSGFASLLFRVPVSDVCSGMWAFRSDLLKTLDLTAQRFELEVDIFAECALRNIPIVEVPIAYRRRIGKGKLRFREGFRIAFALLKKRLRSAPASIEKVRRVADAAAAEAADGGG